MIAVVIGSGGYNELGLIRSCGEAGMKVILVCPDNLVVPINKSRYVTEWVKANPQTEQEVVEIIEKIASNYSGEKIILYPATDAAALLIDRSFARLPKHVFAPNAKGNLDRLMDKWVMTEIASKQNIPVPKSVKLDLEKESVPKYSAPCIIKPLKSVLGEKSSISICQDEQSYCETINYFKKKGQNEVLIQDLVAGANQMEIAITGVSLGNGKVISYGYIEKYRIRDNGSTVFAKYHAQVDPNLQDYAVAFITETGYVGIFDIEFLIKDAGYHFIECNFRNGAYGYAVTSGGFNMPMIFAEGILHDDPPMVKLRDRIFMQERADLHNVLDKTITALQWLKDIWRTDTFLWWNSMDPKPMFRVPNLNRLFIF